MKDAQNRAIPSTPRDALALGFGKWVVVVFCHCCLVKSFIIMKSGCKIPPHETDSVL